MRPPPIIVLDTYPLSSTGHRAIRKSPRYDVTATCQAWIKRCSLAGHRIVVPAIAFYEAVRELERRGAESQIARMTHFAHEDARRYVSITDEDLLLAAKFWAQARNAGTPNASSDALDGDSILAAQVRRLGYADDEIIVATTNVRHLEQFVPAALWTELEP